MVDSCLRKTVLSEQEYKGKTIEFDPDSSPLAWKSYFLYYQNGDETKLKLKRNRLILENKIGKYPITIGGDTSFNFNEKKINKFMELIAETPGLEVKQKLDECHSMHYSVLNFDLVPAIGGLNIIKGKLKIRGNEILYHDLGGTPKFGMYDRLDTFIAFINASFSEKEKLLNIVVNENSLKDLGSFFSNSIFTYSLRGENFKPFYELMMSYCDIYEYCDHFYPFLNEDFINRMIESGKKEISIESKENCITLLEYLDLAQDFWLVKENYLKRMFETCEK